MAREIEDFLVQPLYFARLIFEYLSLVVEYLSLVVEYLSASTRGSGVKHLENSPGRPRRVWCEAFEFLEWSGRESGGGPQATEKAQALDLPLSLQETDSALQESLTSVYPFTSRVLVPNLLLI
jgi:hypothetical protein